MLSSPGTSSPVSQCSSPVQHHARARLVDERALPQQPRVLVHLRAPAPRHQHDLDVRAQARLDRAHPLDRHVPLAVVQQRRAPPEQRAVEIHVHAARARAGMRRKDGRCRAFVAADRARGAPSASTIASGGPATHDRALERAARRGARGRPARARGARRAGQGQAGRAPRGAAPRGARRALAPGDRAPLLPPGGGVYAAWEGPTIVTTGTASGKSLCFNLPTLDVLCRDTQARALYLYPTKALAQDQARALAAFGLTKRVRPAIYDGDTPREARADIRRRANIVLTNPDMLHVGILPNHAAWAELFANLAVVVVDEAHVYRGVFGSHVANVLRRLRRIAAAYGTTPRFLLTSATIANPVELAERLTGLEDVSLIDVDGSPAPGRQIAIWNPPLTDEALGKRRSALARGGRAARATRARRGAADLLHEVAQGRRGAAQAARRRLGGERRPRARRARGPLPRRLHLPAAPRARGPPRPRRAARGDHDRRAGARDRHRRARRRRRRHLPRDRRLAAPDVGPRRAARAGPGGVRRGRGRARPVLLPPPRRLPGAPRRGGDPRPREPGDLPPPSALRRPRGAAVERGRRVPRPALGGPRRGPAERGRAAPPAGREVARRTDRPTGERPALSTYVPRDSGGYPAAEVSLRSASPESFAIVDVASGELLGSTEAARAHSTVHEGAIYLHLGRSYEVRELDLQRRRALVAPFDGDWYTQPKRETDTTIERLLDRRETLGVTLSFGEVAVTDTVLAYQRRRAGGPRVCSTSSGSTCRPRASPRRRSGSSWTRRRWGWARRSRWRRCSARCTQPSTPRSPCCR